MTESRAMICAYLSAVQSWLKLFSSFVFSPLCSVILVCLFQHYWLSSLWYCCCPNPSFYHSCHYCVPHLVIFAFFVIMIPSPVVVAAWNLRSFCFIANLSPYRSDMCRFLLACSCSATSDDKKKGMERYQRNACHAYSHRKLVRAKASNMQPPETAPQFLPLLKSLTASRQAFSNSKDFARSCIYDIEFIHENFQTCSRLYLK